MVVEEAYRVANGSIVWEINVCRNLNDWEVQEFEDLLLLLAELSVSNSDDWAVWKFEKNDVFFVKSYYHHLNRKENVLRCNFPAKQIWKTKAPPCIAFFA